MRFVGDGELNSPIAREMFTRPADEASGAIVELNTRDRVLAVA
jgi:hypothetical protein